MYVRVCLLLLLVQVKEHRKGLREVVCGWFLLVVSLPFRCSKQAQICVCVSLSCMHGNQLACQFCLLSISLRLNTSPLSQFLSSLPAGMDCFQTFARDILCEENVRFWRDAIELRHVADDQVCGPLM